MNLFENILDSIGQLFTNLWSDLSSVTPGIILLVISVFIALVLGFLSRVLFRVLGLNKWGRGSKISKALDVVGIDLKIHVLLGNIVFWLVFIILLEGVAKINGWSSITDKFDDYVVMIPLLLGAIIIVTIGHYVSQIISKIARAVLIKSESKSANVLSTLVYYALMLIIATIALNFIGISTTIITANVSIILGSVLFAFAIGFALSSKDLLKNILSSSYNRSNFEVGQKVEIDGFSGEIIKITNTSVYIKSSTKIRMIPAKRFIEETVDILG